MPTSPDSDAAGWCARCQYCQRIRTARGATFYLCKRAQFDSAYPRYPRVPVVQCAGFVAARAPATPAEKENL